MAEQQQQQQPVDAVELLREYMTANGGPVSFLPAKTDKRFVPMFEMTIEEWNPIVEFLEAFLGRDASERGTVVCDLDIYDFNNPFYSVLLEAAVNAYGTSCRAHAPYAAIDPHITSWLKQWSGRDAQADARIHLVEGNYGAVCDWYTPTFYQDFRQQRTLRCALLNSKDASKHFCDWVLRKLSPTNAYTVQFDKCFLVIHYSGNEDELARTCWFSLHPAVRCMKYSHGKHIYDGRDDAVYLAGVVVSCVEFGLRQADTQRALTTNGHSASSPGFQLGILVLKMMHPLRWRLRKRKVDAK
jgi:hypothetical protein